MRKFLAWASGFLISLSILGLGDYFGGRWFDRLRHKTRDDYFFMDDSLGMRHYPNVELHVPWPESTRGEVVYRTNNRGFREDEPTETDKKDRCRIMVLGDSHTDGVVNNDEAFANLLEQSWNLESEVKLDVINAGSGHSTLYQQMLHLRHNMDLQPDIAVFTFYIGNDYLEILQPYSPRPEISGDTIVERLAIPRPLVQRWSETSLVARLLRRLDTGPLMQAERIKGPAMWQAFTQALFFSENPQSFPVASRLHAHTLHQLVRLAQTHRIGLIVVVLPTKYQIERGSDLATFEALEKLLGMDPRKNIDDEVRGDFVNLLETEGVQYFDPYEHFLSAATKDSMPLYWNSEHHLGQRGHRVLADLLLTYFQNHDNLVTRITE